ncbi:MAG: hypothetical protein ACI8Z9_002224 [Paraglaciecola sp.]|jgi:uncharacterized protein (DUF58 family)
MMDNWQAYVSNWLNKRIPASRTFQLNMRNIFIFPSKFAGLFVLICLALFLLGTNYQNNLMLLLCYFLLSLSLINLFSSYLNFARIHLQLGKVNPVYVGDSVHLPLWLNAKMGNQQGPRGMLEFGFWRQKHPSLVDADALCNPIILDHLCTQRGRLSLPRVTVNSYYPLGLFRCWTHLAFTTDILVYPQPLPCAIELQATGQHTQGANEFSRERGYEDFDSLQAYQQGEPLHHIAWKQLARGRGMVSKTFVASTEQTAWLKLKSCPRAELERNLSHLCFQVLELSRSNHVFGLDLGHNCVKPGSGAEHRTACLQALALFTWRENA